MIGRIGAMRRPPAEHGLPAAVVDVGWVNGLAAIRSLGRAGIHVLAVDHRSSALGFRSRYAERIVSADPHADPTGFVASIRALGGVVVFPTHDEQLNLIAQHLGELEVLAPFPGWDVLERVQSKRAQLDEAVAAGVDVPRTHYPSTAQEARAAAEDIGLPLLVKPEHPVGFKLRFRRQAFRCEYIASLPSVETTTTPLPTFNADCIESKSLLFSSAAGLSLSTMTSMVCFFCLSSLGYSSFSSPSSSLVISPSSLIRENPSCFSWSNSFS